MYIREIKLSIRLDSNNIVYLIIPSCGDVSSLVLDGSNEEAEVRHVNLRTFTFRIYFSKSHTHQSPSLMLIRPLRPPATSPLSWFSRSRPFLMPLKAKITRPAYQTQAASTVFISSPVNHIHRTHSFLAVGQLCRIQRTARRRLGRCPFQYPLRCPHHPTQSTEEIQRPQWIHDPENNPPIEGPHTTPSPMLQITETFYRNIKNPLLPPSSSLVALVPTLSVPAATSPTSLPTLQRMETPAAPLQSSTLASNINSITSLPHTQNHISPTWTASPWAAVSVFPSTLPFASLPRTPLSPCLRQG